MEWITTGKFRLRVVKIPGDGNCLFAAILDQIRLNKIPIYDGANQRELRQLLANHIEGNKEKYTPQILGNLTEMGIKPEGREDEEIAKYIKNMREEGVWGGGEVIAATSNLMRAGVIVFQQGAPPIKFQPEGARAIHIIKLYYRKSSGREEGERDHYDSVVENSLRTAEKGASSSKGINIDGQEDIRATHKGKLSQNKNNQAFKWYPGRTITYDNPYTLIEEEGETHPSSSPPPIKLAKTIKVATWNIRGCSGGEKRKQIENALEEEGVQITAIQESHMTTGCAISQKYSWFLSGGDNSTRTRRGVAFIVRENIGIKVLNFNPHSKNLAMLQIEAQNFKINLVTCHIPDGRTKGKNRDLIELSQMITRLTKSKAPLLILGDFNAHIGKGEVPADNRLVGPNLKHHRTNKNGEELLNMIFLHRLNLRTSWGDCKSVLTTWSNGTQESQIDHILSTNHSISIKVRCKAKWGKGVLTDHKLVLASVLTEQSTPRSGCKHKETPAPSKKKLWNINRLKEKKDCSKFRKEVSEGLKASKERTQQEREGKQEKNTGSWEETCEVLREAASKTLNTPKSPMTPRRRRAIASQQKARFWKERNPELPEVGERLRAANAQRVLMTNLHETEKCNAFFQGISNTDPKVRARETFKFIKKYKRARGGKKYFIPMMKWEAMLQEGATNAKCALIPEKDGVEPPDPPSVREIHKIVKSFKKGTAPGVDRINVELLQESTQEVTEELTNTIRKAWRDNDIPEAWTHTIQVPIPKIKSPKTVEDYRRISLCCVAYKVYAKALLEELEATMKPIPQYQAAFLANRSTDDHIFTANRILEERWREGLVTFALALDLAKAFDTVDHTALVTILKQQGAPHYLINRIIKACIHEKTAIQWFGQFTKFYDKTKGVKQGCPISPYLFSRVLHEVITTTAETLTQFCIDKNNITLPILLAYADDITVIADKLEDMEELIREISTNLLSTGMKLNPDKCEIVIRDPLEETREIDKREITLNGTPIRRVQALKYLGSQVPNKLNRRAMTKSRIIKATNGARLLIPFIQKYNPPWRTIKLMYNTMIAPIATYGLKGIATTKANRIALRKMENHILSLMGQFCQKLPSRSIRVLLDGKTINKRITNMRIKYWAHIQRRPKNSLLQAAEKMRAGKKKIGRPCITWPDTLQKEIRETGIPMDQWTECAETKEETKELAEQIYMINEEGEDSLDEITILGKKKENTEQI